MAKLKILFDCEKIKDTSCGNAAWEMLWKHFNFSKLRLVILFIQIENGIYTIVLEAAGDAKVLELVRKQLKNDKEFWEIAEKSMFHYEVRSHPEEKLEKVGIIAYGRLKLLKTPHSDDVKRSLLKMRPDINENTIGEHSPEDEKIRRKGRIVLLISALGVILILGLLKFIPPSNLKTLLSTTSRLVANKAEEKIFQIKPRELSQEELEQVMLFVKIEGSVDKLKNILDKNADVNVELPDKETPLSLAVKRLNHEAIAYLLQKNANVNWQDAQGKTPLMLAMEKNANEITNAVLVKKPELELRDINGQSAIYYAIRQTDTGNLQLLLKIGAEVNIKDNTGNTPLHQAVLANNLEAVKLLRNYKSNFTKNKDNFTPLALAKKQKNAAIIKALQDE